MPKVSVQVSSHGFRQMCDDLAKMSGKDFAVVVKAQAGAVLKRVMGKTKGANMGKLQKRAKEIRNMERGYFKNPDGTFIAIGSRTKAPFFNSPSASGEPKSYWVGSKNNGNQSVWANYTAHRAAWKARLSKYSRAILNARGFGKSTWYAIAQKIGVEHLLKAPGYVKKAKAVTRKSYDNGDGKEVKNAEEMFVLLRQSYRKLTENGFAANILQAAIRARLKAFKSDINKGVFNDVKKRAQRYPGIFIEEK